MTCKNISILGCGWLGLPLARALVATDFFVKGSTTSQGKLSVLAQSRIEPFLLSLNENEVMGNIDAFLENSEVLIIDIPPKLRGNASENFVAKIRNLIPFLEKSSVTKVLFVSSTSVYADDNLIVTEETTARPETQGGKQLLEVEKMLQNNKNFETTVLRFGGLIGDDRHPVRMLSGRENIENPNGAINLIHQKDCIAIVLMILGQAQNDRLVWQEIFNAVAPFHPTREEYYTQKAIELGLILPRFNKQKPSVGKVISSEKLIKTLGYRFEVLL
ncbi:SDR family NAD(P)-dependent oxidoreductase [Flavobacterium psychrophilum]|uniref:NAD(P)-dependent oxidoreductase n=1 Tax=Flavobacterium psychrophilum TaxID=96345 RepID=UPI000B7C088E|nr:NAD(P)-dependent oxidoreductase [Flavobacterium psychrophilum]EKT4501179.1 SDR family NAD(P)-dependent oxidoreductase [Flavobacterium psychrophilum]ELY2018259.1 SDR family NAD(P)-dependent oxidoreductase [Flavobacterium psychrophilum]SNB03858.1 putative enzyme of sugar metabolism YeeZ [Flavobacterium psychrophilum]SNB95676.1 putative enzyme of sugar metabolism YeeZ [Flavobacterium psychrophilum]GEJ50659.1 epimerase [Flavobacterium psychrophilum]